MRGFHASAVVALLLATSGGCASMCDSSYDCDFHAFGGMRDRTDRRFGRVGSIFAPAAALPSTVSTLVAPPEALPDETGGDATISGDETGEDENSELRERLLDKLDEMDDLPSIPQDEAGTGDINADVVL